MIALKALKFEYYSNKLVLADLYLGGSVCDCCGAYSEYHLSPRKDGYGSQEYFPHAGIEISTKTQADIDLEPFGEVIDILDLGDGDILYIRCALSPGDFQEEEEEEDD